MKVLLKQATILSSTSALHRSVSDILIENGIIQKIAKHIEIDADRIVESNHLCVSGGWLDLFADFAEPGDEHRETLQSGADAAAAGGFTSVMLMPSLNLPVSSRSQVEYLVQRGTSLAVSILPIAAISKNGAGKELSEMYDMMFGGAVAFSDGLDDKTDAGLLLKALQYATAHNAVIIRVPNEQSISAGGLMNEGVASTRLGLPGIPAIAEELAVARDLNLLRYTRSKLHFTGISTERSLQLITAAKNEGLAVTCSVTPHHLYFDEEALGDYDTNFKTMPPLRTAEDRKALITGLLNGEIDGIASHHSPQHSDDKICEFEYAKTGMLNLQTLFASLNSLSGEPEKIVNILSEKNREIFGLPPNAVAENLLAELTVFDPTLPVTFDQINNRSKSANSPFIGAALRGKVLGTFHNKQFISF